ncbi:hypothetical protein ZIOFF_010216 [Zingiber officinale]|uniref:Uncharacterized protein n=1 Tax=Zingiber officinale TaxID=94328 RepID=A0A8J5HP50_ZINOF|nr:hypothetical protein ZIOFF_010216 [Zingiber officinale]
MCFGYVAVSVPCARYGNVSWFVYCKGVPAGQPKLAARRRRINSGDGIIDRRSRGVGMQAGRRLEMKRIRAEVASPATSESSGKAPRRQKASAAPKSGRAKGAASKGNAARKETGEGEIPNAARAPDALDSSVVPSLPVAEEVLAGWADGETAEVGDLLWPLCGIEEEKLSGWFPFVDADFLCPEICQGEEGLGDHDIWQLQHIHEIPQRASK